MNNNANPVTDSTDNSAHENGSVLIVEDDHFIATALQIKLQKAGIHVQVASNGTEGLKELEKAKYDLILLDIMMPGIDGWEVLSQIKQKSIQTKVLVTSNLSQEEDKQKAKELGALDFLIKSDTSLLVIVDTVKRYLTM